MVSGQAEGEMIEQNKAAPKQVLIMPEGSQKIYLERRAEEHCCHGSAICEEQQQAFSVIAMICSTAY